jgi:uncharacterized protein YndB with AHSA1/START domain
MNWQELDDPAMLAERGGGTSGRRAPERPAIRVRRRFMAPPQRVFDAWLDPEVAGTWLFATASRPMARVDIDGRVEGAFCFVERHGGTVIEHTGEYLEITPPSRLVFSLAMERHPHMLTRVSVEIAPLEQGCELALTHDNVPGICAEDTALRWSGILYGLGVTLDPDAIEFHNHQE